MSDGEEGCFYRLGGWCVCGTWQFSLCRKGETTLGVQLHAGAGKSHLDQDGSSGMDKGNCMELGL